MSLSKLPIILACAISVFILSGPASAEQVLIEFRTSGAVPLVAAGDRAGGPHDWNDEERRKRVETRASSIAQARAALLSSLSSDLVSAIIGDYRHFPLLRALVSTRERRALEAHPLVVAVHDDRQRELLTESSLAYMGAQLWHTEGFVGDGTSVAVLDTGIRYWNGHFGDCPQPGAPGCRVLVFEGFAELEWGTGETDPDFVARRSGHGTNVGGIVGDVAPGTGLLSLGVFAWYDSEEDVLSNDSDVAEALDWVIEHRDEYNIIAANMSLGSDVDPAATGYCTGWMAGAYEVVFANTRDAGVLPVVATGNDYVKTAIAPPSCVASAVAVAAGYDNPAFGFECGTGPVVPGAVTCFSDSNALVDLVAPGEDIDAGGLHGMGGTSMAAPHVAGLAALYHSHYATSPIWTLQRMRVDAVTISELSFGQDYVHRSARVGAHEAELTFDSGVVIASDFRGLPIPDGSDVGLRVSGEVTCDNELCAVGVVGRAYLDVSIQHEGTGDLVFELTAPDGTVALWEVFDDDELGVENVNSILGSQHLPSMFEAVRGSPIEGIWELRVVDARSGRRGSLHRAVLMLDSARIELQGLVSVPAIARPDEPFEVVVSLENRGNLSITDAELAVELVDVETDRIVDSAELSLELPSEPGTTSEHRLSLQGPQGSFLVRLVGGLTPDLTPGLSADPGSVNITNRTFASFEIDPEVPTIGEIARLRVVSRGLVESQSWDFGDGSLSNGVEPSHMWHEAGDYEVRLIVDGPDGPSTTARVVTVRDHDLPSPIDVGGGGCSCEVAPGRATSPAAVLFVVFILGVLARRRVAALGVIPILFVVTLSACWDSPTPAQPDAGEVESGPWLSLLDPEGPVIGSVPIHILLSSETSELCDVTVDFRLGDADYQPATISVEELGGERSLPSSPAGQEHAMTWLSATDIPADAPEVRLRVGADCGAAGETLLVESSSFQVLNFFDSHPNAVLITEVSTAESNVPADFNGDYLEITNTTDTTIDLEGWRVVVGAPGASFAEHPLDGASLEPGGRLVVAEIEARVQGAFELEEGLPWSVAYGGSIAVLASYDRGVDFVRWGGLASEPPLGLSWSDDPPLPIPQTLTVLARADEGVDTDMASDFCVASPTPGEPGAGCIVRAEPSEILITELDSQGSNDSVEIFNTTADTVNLGGWVLLWDGDELGGGQVPLGGVDVGPGERVVLQDNGPTGLLHDGILFLGMNLDIDGLIPVALALQDPHGAIIDFVAGGGSRIRWEDWAEEEPTPMPGPRTTLSRKPGDPDTDSSDDFCLTDPNLHTTAVECLQPMDFDILLSEINPGWPVWVELYNPGTEPADLRFVFLSYTSPYFGGAVGDFRLYSVLEPGEFVLVSEQELELFPDAIVVDARRGGIALTPEGPGSVVLRDIHGFGIDFVMWGEPAGTPLWPTRWSGLGLDTHAVDDTISLARYPHDAEDRDSRDDWCWAYPSPRNPNVPCE